MAGYQGRGSKVGNKIVAQSVKEQGGRAAAAKNAAKIAIKAGAFAVNPNKAGKAVSAAKKISKAVSTGKSSSLKKSKVEKLPKMTIEEQKKIYEYNKSIEIAKNGGDDVMANYYKNLRKTFIDSIKNSTK